MSKVDLILEIKNEVSAVVYADKPLKINFSAHLAEKLKYNYTYLANTFAKHEGITLQRFMIKKKVERAEVLLMSDGTASEISNLLNYSSLPHFCNQFKEVTGLTVNKYKKQLKKQLWPK